MVHTNPLTCFGAVILTSPASINWLCNLRGGDVPYTPFALAFGILYANAKIEIFVDLRKVSPSIAAKLTMHSMTPLRQQNWPWRC